MSIANYLYKLNLKIYAIYYTFIGNLKLSLWGIRYGSNCRFRGPIIIYKHINSNIEIGKNARFNSNSKFNFRGLNHPCILQTGCKEAEIIIGDNFGASSCSIVADKGVFIGNNVILGANVIIGDRDDHREIYDVEPDSIIIGNNVWIGMNVTIMKGVTIGDNVIIGASSLVTKNIPANEIWAGNPARFIKKRI